MEQLWIQRRQHDLLKTFCRLTGRRMEDVLDEILLDWASNAGQKQMRAAINSSPFLRNVDNKCVDDRVADNRGLNRSVDRSVDRRTDRAADRSVNAAGKHDAVRGVASIPGISQSSAPSRGPAKVLFIRRDALRP